MVLNGHPHLESIVQKIEGCGLLFLTSYSPSIRAAGLQVLRKAASLDPRFESGARKPSTASQSSPITDIRPTLKRPLKNSVGLVPHNSRILKIMKLGGLDLVKRHYAEPTFASNRNHQSKEADEEDKKHKSELFADRDPLLRILSSTHAKDVQIWTRCFPDLVRWFFDYSSPQVLSVCLSQILSRVNALVASISTGADANSQRLSTGTVKWNTPEKIDRKSTVTLTDDLIDQWSFYISFACANSGIVTVPELRLNHLHGTHLSEGLIKNLLSMLMDLLASERNSIRRSVVTALGCINPSSYNIFLHQAIPHLIASIEHMKPMPKLDVRKSSSSISSVMHKRQERIRMELVHVLSFAADFVDSPEYRNDPSIITKITHYIKQLARFLSNPDVQNEWDHQLVRYYFCGLVGRFYSHLLKAIPVSQGRKAIEDILPFELRMGLFRLFETWCGYGPLADSTRDREAKMMLHVLDQVKDTRERGNLTIMMEDQRKALEVASLKAMASLCYGPLVHASTLTIRFNHHTVISWIESIFASADLKLHPIAQLSLEYVLTSNVDHHELWDLVIRRCYTEKVDSQVAVGFFLVLVDIFCRNGPHPCSITKLCTLALYKIGDRNLNVRKAAARLVISLDGHFAGTPGHRVESTIPIFMDDFDAPVIPEEEVTDLSPLPEHLARLETLNVTAESVMISSQLSAVYREAQMSISERWAESRSEITLSVCRTQC